MISCLSLNEQKEKFQKDQFIKKTQTFQGNQSPQSNVSQFISHHIQQRSNKNFSSLYQSPKALSVDKKVNCQVVEMNPDKLDYFNKSCKVNQNKSNPTKKIQEKIRRVHSNHMNKSQITQSSNNQFNNAIQLNIMNSSGLQQRKYSAVSQILSQEGISQNISKNEIKQQIINATSNNIDKRNSILSNKAKTHQNRSLIKNLDSPRQIASKLKDQAMVDEARNYNLSRQQSLVIKRNNYILQHEVKDYIGVIDENFQKIQQKQGIKQLENYGNEQNSQFYPLNRKSISHSRIQSASLQSTYEIQENVNKEGSAQDQNQSKQVVNSSRTQISQKSYDQILEEATYGIIQKQLLNKEDIYKLWNQSYLTVDHIKQHTRSPSLSYQQQQIKYTPYVPIDSFTSPKSQKSKSVSENTTFSMSNLPQNSNSKLQIKQQTQNFSKLVKETKNQLEKMKQLQMYSASQQNESVYKSIDFTQSTQAGSPVFNFQIQLNNNGVEYDIINEQKLVLNSPEFTPISQPYLSPQNSPRKRITLTKKERPWSTKSSMFQNKKKDISTEMQKIQPQLKSENQETQASNKINTTTKQTTSVQLNKDYEKPDQTEFLPVSNIGLQQQIQKQDSLQLQQQYDNIIDEGDDTSKSKQNIQNMSFSNQSLRSLDSREDMSFDQTPRRNNQRQKQKIKHSGSMSPFPSCESPTSPLIQNIMRMKSKLSSHKNSSSYKKQLERKQNTQDTKRLKYLEEIQKRKQFRAQQELIERKLNRKNLLTKDEIMLYADTRKKYFEQLKDEFEVVKMNYGLNTEKFQDDWGILLQKTNYDIYDSMNSLPEEEKNYNIKQTYICMEEESLYRKVSEINQMLKQCHKTISRKFVRYVKQTQEADKESEKRKYSQRLTQFEVCQDKITIEELKLFVEQLNISANNRNYETLYGIVKKLWFFKKYSLSVSRQIINIGSVICVPKNQIIFKEGDAGDKMYVILKGSVHVRVNHYSTDPEITIKNPVVVTLYDGFPFGDLALINKQIKTSKDSVDLGKILTLKQMREQIQSCQITQIKSVPNFVPKKQSQIALQFPNSYNTLQKLQKTVQAQTEQKKCHRQKLINVFQDSAKNNSKRSATIEAAEETYLLSISRENFSNILLNLILTEMHGKLELLKKISFLADLEYANLITLANYIEVKQFKLGDIILREGEDPQYFCIVQKGKCQIVKEEIIIRPRNTIDQNKAANDQKAFKYGSAQTKNDYKSVFQENNEKTQSQFNHDYFNVINEDYLKNQNKNKDTHDDDDLDQKSINSSLEFEFYEKAEGEQQSPQQQKLNQEDQFQNYKQQSRNKNELKHIIQSEMNEKDVRQYRQLFKDKAHLAFCYFHDFGTMQEGDIFMIRSFLSEQSKVDSTIREEIDYDPFEKARMTVVKQKIRQIQQNLNIFQSLNQISETSNTEIAMIDKGYFHLVAPNLKRLIIDSLTSMKDFDHSFSNENKQWIDRWDNIKMRIFRDQKQFIKQQK